MTLYVCPGIMMYRACWLDAYTNSHNRTQSSIRSQNQNDWNQSISPHYSLSATLLRAHSAAFCLRSLFNDLMRSLTEF